VAGIDALSEPDGPCCRLSAACNELVSRKFVFILNARYLCPRAVHSLQSLNGKSFSIVLV